MVKVKWDLEEAVVLYDLYFKSGATLSVDTEKLNELSAIMKNRAAVKGVQIDEKYRNVTGLTMQIGCIHYVVTDGSVQVHRLPREKTMCLFPCLAGALSEREGNSEAA